MSVPTPYILLSFNPTEILNTLKERDKFIDLSNLDNSTSSTYLFTSQGNANIISFSHTFLNEVVSFELEVIDPKDEFVERFIGVEDNNELAIDRTIYVAYGFGSNPSNWSGPHLTKLRKAKYKLDSASRLSLTLVPTFAPYNEKLPTFSLSEEYKIEHRGVSKSFTPYVPLPSVYGKPEESASELQYDFNSIVKDVLYDYISKAFNNENVEILLPDLNKTLYPLYSNIFYKLGQKTGQDYVSLRKQYLNEVLYKIGLTLSHKLGLSKNIQEDLFNQLKEIDYEEPADLPPSFTQTYDDELTSEYQAKKQEQEQEPVESISITGIDDDGKEISFTMFGKFSEDSGEFMIAGGPTIPWPNISFEELKEIYESLDQKSPSPVDFSPNSNKPGTNVYDLPESAPNTKEENAKLAEKFKTEVVLLTNLEDSTYEEELYKFINKLNSKTERLIVPTFVQETNQNIIDYLYDKGKVKSKTEPILIFGDEKLINDYFYAERDLSKEQPDDKVNEKYDKDYSAFIKQEFNGDFESDLFGQIYSPPREFQFSEKEAAKLRQFPSFKYNTTNSNILTISMKQDNSYFAALNTGFQEFKASNRINNTQKNHSTIPPVPIKEEELNTKGKMIEYILKQGDYTGLTEEEKKELKFDLKAQLSQKLLTQNEKDKEYLLSVEEFEEKTKMIDECFALLKHLSKDKPKFDRVINSITSSKKNIAQIYASFNRRVYEQAVFVEIETLPLFQITKSGKPKQKANMFVLNSPILATNQVVTLENRNKFLSGPYRILGFSHSINTNGASSRFLLAKAL